MESFINSIIKLDTRLNDYPLRNYVVSDIVDRNIRILLILESPHISEILCKCPLSGKSGSSVSKVLGLTEGAYNLPIGKLLKDKINNLDKLIGVMNVCPIPMQAEPYCYSANVEKLINMFKTIRETKSQVKKRRKLLVGKLEGIIEENFYERLASYCEAMREVNYIIPCGTMAAYFTTIYFVSQNYRNFKIIENIPNPSYNQWFKEGVKDELINIIGICKEYGKSNKIQSSD